MTEFDVAYSALNAAQKAAVNTVDGPLMVIAGPGTGKTQLLSVRVANILKNSDAEPRNVLCLTFTDNAARNMRERLETIIGQAAYHVSIHTFHSFGSEIISQYADYFTDRQLLQQVDELGRYQLLHEIFETLPHSNPLSIKAGDDYVLLKDTAQIISWLKQNAIAPKELQALLSHNKLAIEALSSQLSETFTGATSPKQLSHYQKLHDASAKLQDNRLLFGFPEYMKVLCHELQQAIDETPNDGRYAKQITAWRNKWCEKDSNNKHVLKDAGRNLEKMQAVSHIYESLNTAMSKRGLYDFDDMIIETVHALEQHDDLRYTLQEKYQYVLVDEFQDTNKAQLRILQALGSNPVHEGKPNIMVVGDDDQAIYAFQGAEASNMVAFTQLYPAKQITLQDNYRSTTTILEAAESIATQIDDRLTESLGISKQLQAKNSQSKKAETVHTTFESELAQYDWIAQDIKRRLSSGVDPQSIAVIAPRHRYLERLMPYVGQHDIPIAYERRENILDAPLVRQLMTMTKLVVALQNNDLALVNALLAEVLSYEFWKIDDEILVKTSADIYNAHTTWLEHCTNHTDSTICSITKWFVHLARLAPTEPLEYILDELLGPSEPIDSFHSPLRMTLFSEDSLNQETDEYLTLLGQLSSLRQALRQWKPDTLLLASDMIEFTTLHTNAGLKIIDNNPHTQTTNAVQIMTVYKAKGLEFDYVYVINAQDEVWGPTARSQHSRIRLPANMPIAPTSSGDNDRLRLLFVALTRARHSIVISSYQQTLENKTSPPLSFLRDTTSSYRHEIFAPVNNPAATTVESVAILSTDWSYRYRQVIADKPTIFAPLLANYKLSVTHLNNFLDIEKGGPQYFFTRNFLRFPEAPTPAAAYGDAIHKTIQWAHSNLRNDGSLPSATALESCFSDFLRRKHLRNSDFERLHTRGKQAITRFIQEYGPELRVTDFVERGFNNEGTVVADAKLSGKIDKMRIENNQCIVSDFKTGKPASSWNGKDAYEKVKLHRYRQQLLFYKLLIEGSASYNGKVEVVEGQIVFVEANNNNELVPPLTTTFDKKEIESFLRLIETIWKHIQNLDFPDISQYSSDLKGVLRFEEDLRQGTI